MVATVAINGSRCLLMPIRPSRYGTRPPGRTLSTVNVLFAAASYVAQSGALYRRQFPHQRETSFQAAIGRLQHFAKRGSRAARTSNIGTLHQGGRTSCYLLEHCRVG